jgi:hypothetical protein
MKSSQFVFSNQPIFWDQGVDCAFHQLPEVIARAKTDGFVAVRMTTQPGGYSIQFQRAASAKPEGKLT